MVRERRGRHPLGPGWVWLWLGTAWAGPCPEVGVQVASAQTAFEDAELGESRRLLEEAERSLSCQTAPVPNADLIALYRLDALVSLAQQDQKGAVGATVRAVAADPDAAPPADQGPQIQELFQTWSVRLRERMVRVGVIDGGEAWIDGRPLTWEGPLDVVEGEHLVQIQTEGAFTSEMKELSGGTWPITTGVALPEGVVVPALVAPAVAVVPDPKASGRRRPAALWGTGIGLAAVGGAAVGFGAVGQRQFLADPFDADQYGACIRTDACYGEAREQAIRGEATRIRAFYGVGYGLVGVGAILGVTGLVGLPISTDGATIRWEGRW